MQVDLAAWKKTLQTEIGVIEQQVSALTAELAEKKKKYAAIDHLLIGDDQAHTGSSTTSPLNNTEAPNEQDYITPAKEFWRPILQTLVEMGGKARGDEVIKAVGEKLKNTLTAVDHEKLESDQVRWENRTAWQASNMRSLGLISKFSRRGVWEITSEGQAWLDTNA
ncbi:MAG: hypothetical protein NVS9B15_04560 [Acidobacteriaceae bacterium]